jgi:nucleoside phosphorylase
MDNILELFKKCSQFSHDARGILGTSQKILGVESLFDIGIITSTDDEFNTIKNLIENCVEYEPEQSDSTIYYKGIIHSAQKDFKVILPYPLAMGLEASVCITTKLISCFNPSYLFMSGICAGNKNITNIGDIVIAEKSVNYNNVVEIDKEGRDSKKKFMQNADSINKKFKARLSLFSHSPLIASIKDEYPDKQKFPKDLGCHIGLVVTGSSLVRSAPKIKEISDTYHGVIAMDMETHGFYFTASNSVKEISPIFVSIKGVSDFGDDTSHAVSSDDRRKYALYTSSMALFTFITTEIK